MFYFSSIARCTRYSLLPTGSNTGGGGGGGEGGGGAKGARAPPLQVNNNHDIIFIMKMVHSTFIGD